MAELEPFGNAEMLALPPWLDRKTGKIRTGEHSPLGPSSSHRWFECPGSVRLAWNIHGDSSVYADEGTAAHELGAKCLLDGGDAWEHAGEVITVKGQEAGAPIERKFTVDEGMVDAVQVYLNTIRGDMAEDPNAEMKVEVKFDMSDIARGVYGTSDAPVYFPKRSLLRVYDYKHGVGVAVEVDGNPQLLTYGAGALHELSSQWAVDEIELVIVQPRASHSGGPVRRWRIRVADLGQWVATELVEGVKRAEDPDAPLKQGAWCQFCPAKLGCPAMQQAIVAIEADAKVVSVAELTTYELAERVRKWRLLKTYGKALEDELYLRVTKRGETAPGFKAVEGKSDRVFKEVIMNPDTMETEVFLDAVKKAFGDDAYTEPKVKSPAQIEKLPGGKAFVVKWAYKPVGNLTLVEEGDKRGAVKVRKAQDVFAHVANSAN